jgi:hypothetical protein
VTFDAMRDLVTTFYSQLPADPTAAWAKLDSHYQNRNGLPDFLGFSPRGATVGCSTTGGAGMASPE